MSYALFAALFSGQLAPGVRPAAWALSAALTVSGVARTYVARQILGGTKVGSARRIGRSLLAITQLHGVLFGLFVTYAIWQVRGDTRLECLIVVGVAGFSKRKFARTISISDGSLAERRRTALAGLRLDGVRGARYGWVLGAIMLTHSVAIFLLVRMSSAHTRGMFVAQLRLEAQSEDLRKARDAAEEASSARMRFLTNMSHEIRTPLNGIMGLAEILRASQLNGDQREMLVDLDRSGQHLLSVVNDILDMAKVTSGKLTLETVAFDLKRLVRDVAAPAAVLAEAKRLRFVATEAAGTPLRALGDPVRIRQVLSNLLGNAVKFTERGEVRLSVSAPRQGWIRFDVHDTGIGMTPLQLGELFQEFHQADSSTTRKFGGTGLGLAISKRLVAAMGGDLRAESPAGKGAHFFFEIPLAASEEAPQLPVGRAPASLPAGLRVLVAEDNPVNQKVIAIMLKSAGAVVEVAGNGRIAVERCCDSAYDLILMDCQMPELDGFEATARIRALCDSRSRTAIIGVTANAFSEDRMRCFHAGMDGYLAKPLRRDALIEAISKVLTAMPAEAAIEAGSTEPSAIGQACG